MAIFKLDYSFARLHGESRICSALFALFGSTELRDIPEMLSNRFGLIGRAFR